MDMHLRSAILGLFAVAFLTCRAHAQASVTTYGETPEADRSIYLGTPVIHPEAFSGIWEAPDGHGGAVGIHLILMTMVPGDASPPVWIPQYWQHLDISVFERKGPELMFGEENYFADNLRGGRVKIENGRLELHFASPLPREPSIDLDLVRQPDDCWQGRFHRDDFDSAVTLCRPASGRQPESSSLNGTWSRDHGDGCIHIFEDGPGTFTGWTDALEIPGHILFSRNDPGPHNLYQSYGELAKVRLVGGRAASLEFAAYNPMCCSQLFTGTLSADGSVIQEDFPPGSHQSSPRAIWTKVRGDACVDPSEVRKVHSTICLPATK